MEILTDIRNRPGEKVKNGDVIVEISDMDKVWVIAYGVCLKILNSDPKYALSFDMIVFTWMNLLLGLAIFYFAYFRFSFMVAMGFYLFSMIFPLLIQTLLKRTTGFVLEDFNQPLGLSIIALSLFLFSFFHSIAYFRKKDL